MFWRIRKNREGKQGTQNQKDLQKNRKATRYNDENTGKVFVYNHKTEKNKPMFLEEQIRESIPVDGEKNETV